MQAVDTHAELLTYSGLEDGTIFLVREDETRGGETNLYEYINGQWVFLAPFGVNLDNYATIDMLNTTVQMALSDLEPLILSRASAAVVGALTDPTATTVNNTNTIVSMLKGILNVVLTNLGNATQAASSAATAAISLHQRVRELLDNRVGAVNATGGTNTAGGANAKLNAFIAAALNAGGIGAITRMRVQTGTFTINFPTSGAGSSGVPGNFDLPISSVNVNRAFTLYSHEDIGLTGTAMFGTKIGSLPNSTTIRIRGSGSGNTVFRWIVISFDN